MPLFHYRFFVDCFEFECGPAQWEVSKICLSCGIVQRSVPWEADIHSVDQEIACLLWYPEVHYHVHRSTYLRPSVTFCNLLVFMVRGCYLLSNPQAIGPPFLLFLNHRLCHSVVTMDLLSMAFKLVVFLFWIMVCFSLRRHHSHVQNCITKTWQACCQYRVIGISL